MGKLDQLMEKKAGSAGEMDPARREAKMNMLKALRNEMSQMMSGDLKGAKKVEIQADDTDGLEDGLDKAKELLSGGDEDESAEDGLSALGDETKMSDTTSHGGESDSFGLDHASESPEMEQHEGEITGHGMDLSDEDIQHLESMLAEAKAKKGMR